MLVEVMSPPLFLRCRGRSIGPSTDNPIAVRFGRARASKVCDEHRRLPTQREPVPAAKTYNERRSGVRKLTRAAGPHYALRDPHAPRTVMAALRLATGSGAHGRVQRPGAHDRSPDGHVDRVSAKETGLRTPTRHRGQIEVIDQPRSGGTLDEHETVDCLVLDLVERFRCSVPEHLVLPFKALGSYGRTAIAF